MKRAWSAGRASDAFHKPEREAGRIAGQIHRSIANRARSAPIHGVVLDRIPRNFSPDDLRDYVVASDAPQSGDRLKPLSGRVFKREMLSCRHGGLSDSAGG